MLFIDGFHKGFRPKRSRPHARCAAGLVTGAAQPEPSPVRAPVAHPATTIITIRDKKNSNRKKTIITLKRRAATGPSKTPAGKTEGATTKVRAEPPTPARKETGVFRVSSDEKKHVPENSGGFNEALVPVPDSPTSTLLGCRADGVAVKTASYNSPGSAYLNGSESSCDTTLTHVDDGLSDWGLPKIVDPYDALDDTEDEDDEAFLDEGLPIALPTLGASVFPYEAHIEPAAPTVPLTAVSPAPLAPSAAQRRLQQFLVLMYIANFLKKRGIVPNSFGSHRSAAPPLPTAPTPQSLRKSPFSLILPFASWI